MLGLLAPVAAAIALSPTATLDKTLVCSPQYGDLDVAASPRGDFAYATARTVSSGYLGLNTGAFGGRANLLHVRARREKSALANVAAQPEGIYAGAGRCFLSRKTAPLTSKGLRGPAVTWATDRTCLVTGRLVVRIRAEVASSSSWRRLDEDFFGVRTNVASAQLAVRTERGGKPVAYATLDRAGRTKLWVRADCA